GVFFRDRRDRGHFPALHHSATGRMTVSGCSLAAHFSAGYSRPMDEISRILGAMEHGDPHAAGELLPLVYKELRRLAAARLADEKPGQTLQPTALVHEAYLRLVEDRDERIGKNRRHFFAAAAEAMRRILVENARRKKRLKRGGNRRRLDVAEVLLPAAARSDELLALDEALDAL